MRPQPRVYLLAAILLTAAPAANAHDFWIEPSAFGSPSGTAIRIGLRVGHRLDGVAVPRMTEQIARFVAVSSSSTVDIPGVEGVDPAGFVRLAAPGLSLIAYQSRGALNELPAENFEAYLREEGLETIAMQRRQLGESDRPGRERFVRCAKSLLVCGGSSDGPFDRAIGMPMEITPEQNPYGAKVGDMFSLRVLHDGQPLKEARVVIACRGASAASATLRTDAEGRVRFKLGQPGTWFVQSVQMIRAQGQADVEWESYWASLTFEVK